jgi:hypothetical protein
MQRFYREYYKMYIQALQNAADKADRYHNYYFLLLLLQHPAAYIYSYTSRWNTINHDYMVSDVVTVRSTSASCHLFNRLSRR